MEPIDVREEGGEERASWMDRLNVMLERLQDEDSEKHQLVWARYLGKQSIQALVVATGWTANEVRCRIYRGIQKLRSWAREYHLDSEEGP